MQVSLTQHGDRGPGGADGHGEDGAGVLALVGQLHVVDGDGELGGRGAVQLDTVVSERWRTERDRRRRRGTEDGETFAQFQLFTASSFVLVDSN